MFKTIFLRVVFLLLHCVIGNFLYGQITIQSPVVFSGPVFPANNDDTLYVFCKSDTVKFLAPTTPSSSRSWFNLNLASQEYSVLSGGKTTQSIILKIKTSNTLVLAWGSLLNAVGIRFSVQKPSIPNARNDTIICQNSIKLNANKPAIGKGKWLSPYNPGITFQNDTLPNTTASNLPRGKSTFIWQIGSICDTLRDTLIVENHAVSPNAGVDQVVCNNSAQLQADSLLSGQTGQWSLVVGVGFDPNSLNPVVSNLEEGKSPYKFIWRVKDSICEATDTVVVTYNKLKTAKIVYPSTKDTTVCSNQITLKADAVKGTWTKKNATFSDTLQNTPIILSTDTNIFYRTVKNPNCATSIDSVKIINHTVVPPTVRHDTCLFYQSGLSLSLLASTPKAGNWFPPSSNLVVEDSVRANYLNPSSAGHYSFYYKVTNGICKDSAKTQFSLLTKAVLPSDICLFVNAGETASVSFRAKNKPNTANGEKGTWVRLSPSTFTGQFLQKSPNDSVEFKNLPVGKYRYEWSIRDTACVACTCNKKNADTITITVTEKAKIVASGSVLCTNNDTVSVMANLPSTSIGAWTADTALGLSVFGKKVLVSKLKIGDNKLFYSLSDNGCATSDGTTITRLTKPSPILDKCYLADVDLRDTIVATPPSQLSGVNETANWRLPQNLAFSFIANVPNKIVIGKNSSSDTVIRYSISGKCQMVNSSEFKVTFLKKPKAPLDTFITLPISSPTILTASEIEASETVKWFGPNGKLLSTNSSFSLPDTVAGKYNFRVQKTGKNGCSKEDTVSVTYISNARILTNSCSKQIKNLNVVAAPINTNADTGVWVINPPLLYSYSNFPNQITVAKVDSVGEITATWTVTSKKNKAVKVSHSVRFVTITKPVLSGILPICAKDSFYVLNEAKNLNLKPFEIGHWEKKEPLQPGILKNQSSIVDTIRQLKSSSQIVYFIIKDKFSTCSDTASAVLNVVTKAIAGTQICTTDTNVRLNANSPNLATEYGKWQYRISTFNKVPTILKPSSPSSDVKGLGERRTRFAWTIRNKNDSTKCFTLDSVRVVVNTKAKVDLKDPCLKGTNLATLQGNSINLIKGYEKAAWVLATNTSDTISRKTTDTTSKVKIGTSKLYYTVCDTTYKSCRTRDSLSIFVINKAVINKTVSCLIKQTDKDSIFISTSKAKDNTHMAYSWVKPFSNVTDTVFKSKPSTSTDSIHTFLLPTLGNRKFYWKAMSDQNAACFHLDTINLTTVSKAKVSATSPICTTDSMVNLVSSNDSNAVETGQWSYLSSFSKNAPVFVNSTSYKNARVVSLGERDTKLLWKVTNKQVPSCFSVDSLNTTIVKNTKAQVSYKDTCIKETKMVWLRGFAPKSYEKVSWTLLKDTASRKNIDTVVAKIGSTRYVYTIVDQLYTKCYSKDSLMVHSINKVVRGDMDYCLIKQPSDPIVELKLATKKDKDTTGLKYEWISKIILAGDVAMTLPSSVQFDSTKFGFVQTGNRVYTRKISARLLPSCQDTVSYLFTLIPKAMAVIDSCLVGKNDTVNLRSSNALLSSKGEKGLWKPASTLKFLLSDTLAVSKVAGIQKGKTEFVWTVSNGMCKDSVKRKVLYISKASILNLDTCRYFDPILNIQLKHDTILNASESGKWKPFGAVVIDAKNTASKFIKGANKIQWKVYSNFDSTCSDASTISFNLLSPSGFGSDTVFTCFRDDTLVALGNLLKNEVVTWRISSMKNDTSVLVYSDSVSARLRKMSNQYPYSLYRQIKTSSCVLTDKLIVKNQQLDTVFIKPKNGLLKVDGTRNSYYTCQTGVEFLMNDPDQEIKGATGHASVLERQSLSYNVKFLGTTKGNVIYNSETLENPGLYTVSWTVSNKNCKAMSDTIQLVKRERWTDSDYDQNFKTSICGLDTFSFAQTGLKLIVNPDKDSYRNLDSTSSATLDLPPTTDTIRKNMVARRLLYGANQFFYSANKLGCVANTFVEIIRSRSSYMVCGNINCDTSANKLVLCKQDSSIITGTYTLNNPSFDVGRFRIYWSNSKSDTTSVSDTTNIKYLNIDKKNSKVSAKVYNKTLDKAKKIYLISKNGVCPAKIDSVTIINYRSVKGQPKIITTQSKICNDSLLLNSTMPTIGTGRWSFSDTNASFSAPNDTASLLTKLALGNQEVKWKVVNGICEDSDSLLLEVGQPVGKATLLTANRLELCDADSIQLNAVAPLNNVTGSWYLLKSINSLVKQTEDTTLKVPLSKANISVFKWVLSSDICSDTAIVTVRNDKKPSVAVVGSDQSVKTSTTTITANEPVDGIGKWELVNGTATIVSPFSSSTTVQNLPFGETSLKWIITNGVCAPSEAIMKILFTDFDIPQAFSPNGDNKNDRFEIVGIENYPNSKLIVMNRWGREVFSSSNYKNDWEGDGQDEDTYFYVLEIKGVGIRRGYVILKRK